MSSPHTEQFWQLLAATSSTANAPLLNALTVELARRPIPRIVQFHRTLMDLCDQALTWQLWDAADIVFEPYGASADGFVYFRLWLIGQGRVTFERALRHPDSLADHPAIRRFIRGDRSNEAFPHLEALMSVADEAFDRVLTKLSPMVAARIKRPGDLDQRPREAPWAARPKQPTHHPRLTRLLQSVA